MLSQLISSSGHIQRDGCRCKRTPNLDMDKQCTYLEVPIATFIPYGLTPVPVQCQTMPNRTPLHLRQRLAEGPSSVIELRLSSVRMPPFPFSPPWVRELSVTGGWQLKSMLEEGL